MKETICTIPINDVFLPKDGCPICRMYNMLEAQYVEYITGAAMMEPSVRIQTNQKGFCHTHFNMMVTGGNRLSNALILESHLQDIIDNRMPSPKGKPDKKRLAAIDELAGTCYVCDRIYHDMEHFFATIFVEWQNTPEFKQLYGEQPYICLNHYSMLMQSAMGKRGVASKNMAEFNSVTTGLTGNYLNTLKADITHFSSMFDYRNRGGDWGNSKNAIERSVQFLTGKEVDAPDNNEPPDEDNA